MLRAFAGRSGVNEQIGMRIVAGKYKGHALASARGRTTRPTTDRAREAIFNILASAPWAPDIEGARVLDLFAGSGALGLEALSRGAGFCLFVEADASARAAIRNNVEALGLFGQTRLHRRDAAALGKRPQTLNAPFDLVFLDPPYGKGLGAAALSAIASGNWIASGALIVFECGAREAPATDGFAVLDERLYGAAKIIFLRA